VIELSASGGLGVLGWKIVEGFVSSRFDISLLLKKCSDYS